MYRVPVALKKASSFFLKSPSRPSKIELFFKRVTNNTEKAELSVIRVRSSPSKINLFFFKKKKALVEPTVRYKVAEMHRVPYLYRSLSAKEPFNWWLFCRKRPVKTRPPVHFRHPVPNHVYIYIVYNIYISR